MRQSEESNASEQSRFVTAIDTWLGVMMAGCVLCAIALPVAHLTGMMGQGQPWSPAVVFLPLVIMSLSLILAVPCFYEIEGDTLVVRSGLLRRRIPVRAIESVRQTTSMVSAPAWSLDRLEILYGRGHRVLISPRERSGFLRALQAAAPQLEWEGGDLAASAAFREAQRQLRQQEQRKLIP